MVQCYQYMLEKCAVMHPYLQKALPTMGNRLHDTHEQVRKAMLTLLTTTKKVRGINFWSIVPVYELVARLSVEKEQSGLKILELLMGGFFPVEKSEEDKIRRCIYLVKMDRENSRKFYDYASGQITVHDTVKFVLAVLKYVRLHVKQVVATPEDGDKENAGTTNSKGGGKKTRAKGRRPLQNAGDTANESSVSENSTLDTTSDTVGTLSLSTLK